MWIWRRYTHCSSLLLPLPFTSVAPQWTSCTPNSASESVSRTPLQQAPLVCDRNWDFGRLKKRWCCFNIIGNLLKNFSDWFHGVTRESKARGGSPHVCMPWASGSPLPLPTSGVPHWAFEYLKLELGTNCIKIYVIGLKIIKWDEITKVLNINRKMFSG